MRKNILRVLVIMSKSFIHGIVVTCLFAGVLFAREGNAQGWLIKEVMVLVEPDGATLKQLTDAIEAKIAASIAHVFLPDKTITCKVNGKKERPLPRVSIATLYESGLHLQMKNFDLKEYVLEGFIALLVVVIGGILLRFLRKSKLKLEYIFLETIPFNRPTETFNIYPVKIQNTGNKVLEKVVCHIKIKPAQIEEYSVSPNSAIIYSDILNGERIELKIPSLNPGEWCIIAVLASSSSSFPEQPDVKLRAKGVNGQLAKREGMGKKLKHFF